MPPFSYTYTYSFDDYDTYKHSLMNLIYCCYGSSYLKNYGDKIISYIMVVMESNYGKNVKNWEVLEETELADYIKEIDFYA